MTGISSCICVMGKVAGDTGVLTRSSGPGETWLKSSLLLVGMAHSFDKPPESIRFAWLACGITTRIGDW